MVEEKRKVGRPRKHPVVSAADENPDHKPATLGQVKCLIRNTRDHTHGQKIYYWWCGLAAAVGSIYILSSYCLALISRGAFVLGIEHAFAGAIALVCAMVAIDMSNNGCLQTDDVTQDTPKIIKKHKLTKCEEDAKYEAEAHARWNDLYKNKCDDE